MEVGIMVEITDLRTGYAGEEILHGLSLSFQPGQVTMVLGPNGCGKSTLLKALCGILPVTGGQIRLDGQDLLTMPRNIRAQKVAYLSQNRQVPDITVRRMVLHGRFPYLSYPRRYRTEDYAAAQQAMEQLGIGNLADLPLKQLSGGQRQKVYIAMALAQDTPVLLLDEPTTFLDISHQMQLMDRAKALAAQGKHVLMVIHDLTAALENGDTLLLMDQGNLLFSGSSQELCRSGLLQQVFSVRLCQMQTPHGCRYYYA